MSAKAWSHQSGFLDKTAADWLYRRMMQEPWSDPDGENMGHILYGTSYLAYAGGGVKGEIATVPEFLRRLADKISQHPQVQTPVNYVQCHCVGPNGLVRPHRDPAGMIVPMLTVGMEKTFRVGGTCPTDIPKTQRPVELHLPEDEYLMRHGDLLVFNGGRTWHSMFPAGQDTQFNANGYDYRISILFRWTTSIVRALGCDRAKWCQAQTAQHEKEYAAAQTSWMESHATQPSLF